MPAVPEDDPPVAAEAAEEAAAEGAVLGEEVTREPLAQLPLQEVPRSPGSRTSRQQSVDNSEIVLGTPLTDNGMTRIVQRVIVLATLVASYYTVNFIAELLNGAYSTQDSADATSLWAAGSSLLIELSIPACGYLGAMYNNRQLTCCFCSCNLFIAVVSVMSFIRTHVRVAELAGNCAAETSSQQRRTCEAWTNDGVERYMMLSSSVAIVVLGCTASWAGNALYNRLARDPRALSAHVIRPMLGEVISLSPSSGRSRGASVVWEISSGGASLPRVSGGTPSYSASTEAPGDVDPDPPSYARIGSGGGSVRGASPNGEGLDFVAHVGASAADGAHDSLPGRRGVAAQGA